MIIEIPNYVPIDLVSEVRDAVSTMTEFSTLPTYNREGKTTNISGEEDLKYLDSKLLGLFDKIQREVVAPTFNPLFPSADSGYEYHKYASGQICKEHCDGDVSKGIVRYATVIIFLTTHGEGGELVFPKQDRRIKTEAGKIVVFPPNGMYPHYTEPCTEQREILMTWFYYANVQANIWE